VCPDKKHVSLYDGSQGRKWLAFSARRLAKRESQRSWRRLRDELRACWTVHALLILGWAGCICAALTAHYSTRDKGEIFYFFLLSVLYAVLCYTNRSDLK
jgi:uncharacterized membrane protein YsdA (DUF1294 family)